MTLAHTWHHCRSGWTESLHCVTRNSYLTSGLHSLVSLRAAQHHRPKASAPTESQRTRTRIHESPSAASTSPSSHSLAVDKVMHIMQGAYSHPNGEMMHHYLTSYDTTLWQEFGNNAVISMRHRRITSCQRALPSWQAPGILKLPCYPPCGCLRSLGGLHFSNPCGLHS
jgi:hypothetical protein